MGWRWGGGGECHVGTQDELMFRLFRVSVSIFPALTDRPINLIYRVSPHPLTSSTGLLSNNERQRPGTVGALVPIVLARRAIIKVTQRKHSPRRRSGLSSAIGRLHVELHESGSYLRETYELTRQVVWVLGGGGALIEQQSDDLTLPINKKKSNRSFSNSLASYG